MNPRLHTAPLTWPVPTGSLLQDDQRRGPQDRLPKACPAALDFLPRLAGRTDQDERQRPQLLHFPHRHSQADQDQGKRHLGRDNLQARSTHASALPQLPQPPRPAGVQGGQLLAAPLQGLSLGPFKEAVFLACLSHRDTVLGVQLWRCDLMLVNVAVGVFLSPGQEPGWHPGAGGGGGGEPRTVWGITRQDSDTAAGCGQPSLGPGPSTEAPQQNSPACSKCSGMSPRHSGAAGLCVRPALQGLVPLCANLPPRAAPGC